MDLFELVRRWRRSTDCVISYRKAFLIAIAFFATLLYIGPTLFRLLFGSYPIPIFLDTTSRCIYDRLRNFQRSAEVFDAQVSQRFSGAKDPVLFVGNGKVGLEVKYGLPLYISDGRFLNLTVPYYPVVNAKIIDEYKEATVVEFVTGTVNRFQCIYKKRTQNVDVSTTTYAHRSIPSIIVQDIRVTNPLDEVLYVEFEQTGASGWRNAKISQLSLSEFGQEFSVVKGLIRASERDETVYVVVIISHILRDTVKVLQQRSETVHHLTAVSYDGPIPRSKSDRALDRIYKEAEQNLRVALGYSTKMLLQEHKSIWRQLFSSGFRISYSKAADALNGDKVNATLYYVLSHHRSPMHEVDVSDARKYQLGSLLFYPDRCYDGHHTLQALALWPELNSIASINQMVHLWILTLTKQGCYSLLQAGADGVLQAMILSFGALKFSNHHLEFGTPPRDLHRDYDFRRISYGNATHVNLTVEVGDDNKAMIYVALDRSDKNYYACDGGCLDPPIQLGTEKKAFPVKLTDPPTAILYITADRQHMEELKHTIHVKEVAEAPAHEHHLLALHRHGHQLGGLPVIFWVSIGCLVLIFHLFLFKLIYNEYCSASAQVTFNNYQKVRTKYVL